MDREPKRARRNQKRRVNIPVTVWIAVSIAFMFVQVDFGLLLLLIGGVVLLFRFAIKKDREIAQRKKTKRAAQKEEMVAPVAQTRSARRASPAPAAAGISVEYVGPESGERVPVRVAGVTFANGRRQRQTILREIYWKDKEYSGPVCVRLRRSEFEGKESVEVWANEEQIGFVPKSQTDYFLANWDRLKECRDLKVYGGGQKQNGETLSFGASFVAVFNDSQTSANC